MGQWRDVGQSGRPLHGRGRLKNGNVLCECPDKRGRERVRKRERESEKEREKERECEKEREREKK